MVAGLAVLVLLGGGMDLLGFDPRAITRPSGTNDLAARFGLLASAWDSIRDMLREMTPWMGVSLGIACMFYLISRNLDQAIARLATRIAVLEHRTRHLKD